MGIFNRSITVANRKVIAAQLANLLSVTEPVPDSFEGIPILNNQKSWFFGYARDRQPDDIDKLWEIFSAALTFSESDDSASRSSFSRAYDEASRIKGVGWNLTMGLYWIRPWVFPTLDSQSRRYIKDHLDIDIDTHGHGGRCSADDYLNLMAVLDNCFHETSSPVHSFPELSLAAWNHEGIEDSHESQSPATHGLTETTAAIAEKSAEYQPYTVSSIIEDGCFLPRDKIESILGRLRAKKNLILQGPPGTGKSWLAKRLAFALTGCRDEKRIRAVQFHPNLSYEDFIRGWRPSGDGRLDLVDGPFLKMVRTAIDNPETRYIVVIEEINRGNPAQILGEMLTLLEADKRTPEEALALSYPRYDSERVFIPDNLFVVGTMNIADRSLALVDLALRRRFAFVDLEPALGKPWKEWLQFRCGIEAEDISEIERRMTKLNDDIANDPGLGSQFRIGHSYVTPPSGIRIESARTWFRQVVETEIRPLLDEYWFDAPGKAAQAEKHLLDGF